MQGTSRVLAAVALGIATPYLTALLTVVADAFVWQLVRSSPWLDLILIILLAAVSVATLLCFVESKPFGVASISFLVCGYFCSWAFGFLAYAKVNAHWTAYQAVFWTPLVSFLLATFHLMLRRSRAQR